MVGKEDRGVSNGCLALRFTKLEVSWDDGLTCCGREGMQQKPQHERRLGVNARGQPGWLLWVCCCRAECKQFLGTIFPQVISIIKGSCREGIVKITAVDSVHHLR